MNRIVDRPSPGITAALILLLCLTSGCFIKMSIPFPGTGGGALVEVTVAGEGTDKILLVDLSDVFTEEEKGGSFRIGRKSSTVNRLKAQLEKAEEDPDVKALLLRLNTPGGTVTASDILHHEIVRFKEEKGVPVIAEMMGVSASGGYYVACAADRIMAHPTTITGSIGVLWRGMNFESLFQKIGVEDTSLKTGDKKDIGSPFRERTAEEEAIMGALLDDFLERFVSIVEDSRPDITPESMETITDGRIFTANQALELKLIDEIGYLEDAVKEAKREAGLAEARVVVYRPESRQGAGNIYAALSDLEELRFSLVNIEADSLLNGLQPGFYYLWAPGSGSM
ncbi:signal peptide peptidase SppA [Thermodesulfobacteriota bacterium]